MELTVSIQTLSFATSETLQTKVKIGAKGQLSKHNVGSMPTSLGRPETCVTRHIEKQLVEDTLMTAPR